MGIFETLFGKKKKDAAKGSKAAAKASTNGPRDDLKARGFSSQSADDYIGLVETTMFKRGSS
ncbi:MAG: hypothetical protein ACKVJG_20050 [Candidatus Latescibacterota bacterium]|jgi:hypothetical protein|tara:strand:+ start:377 stop:562 length:186 start_codon:yes stop_codon:yes gene_type:complete